MYGMDLEFSVVLWAVSMVVVVIAMAIETFWN